MSNRLTRHARLSRYRLGVRIGPVKARMVDEIMRNPHMSKHELAKLFKVTEHSVRQHISRINATLKETDFAIVSDRTYRVVKRERRAVS